MFNLTGRALGKYRLVEKLGQGGMAQVYKGYHPHLTGDEAFAARFQREARAIAALEHPHIIRLYDYNADEEGAPSSRRTTHGAPSSRRTTYGAPSSRRQPLRDGDEIGIGSAVFTFRDPEATIRQSKFPLLVVNEASGQGDLDRRLGQPQPHLLLVPCTFRACEAPPATRPAIRNT